MILNNNYGKLLSSCLQMIANRREISSSHARNVLTKLYGLKSDEQSDNLEVQIRVSLYRGSGDGILIYIVHLSSALLHLGLPPRHFLHLQGISTRQISDTSSNVIKTGTRVGLSYILCSLVNGSRIWRKPQIGQSWYALIITHYFKASALVGIDSLCEEFLSYKNAFTLPLVY